MSVPVAIVVPLSDSRKWFFDRFAYPSLVASGPRELVVVPGHGGAVEKRNAGAAKTSAPNLLFVDDDTVLGTDCLRKMLAALTSSSGASFSYCDYAAIPWPGVKAVSGKGHICHSHEFDLASLRSSNYIDTTSLVRRSVFPGFDPTLQRFQDWDLWLTITGRGHAGVHIPEVLFAKFMLDPGITGSVSMGPASSYIKKKHRI